MAVIAGASEKTSAYKGEPTKGRGEVDFSNERVSEMEYGRRWISSLGALLPW